MIIDRFPKIERFSPHCLLGCVEAICRHRYSIDSLAVCYYNHTFAYSRPPVIARKATGLVLDVYFGSVMTDARRTIDGRLRDLFGVRLREQGFGTFEAFECYAKESIEAQVPFVMLFDLFYLPGRREYHEIHQPHYIALFGLEQSTGTFHAAEQMLGHVLISRADIAAYFENIRDGRPVPVIECQRDGTPSIANPGEWLRDDVTSFLENLLSTSSERGLAAFGKFLCDVREFWATEGAERTFYVPGLWSMSHDRVNFKNALLRLCALDPALPAAQMEALADQLQDLHLKWLAVDYGIEAAIKMDRPRLQARTLSMMYNILEMEGRAVQLLSEVRERLGTARMSSAR